MKIYALRTLRDTIIAYASWARVAVRVRLGMARTTSTPTVRHLLLIASDFPPYISGGVYRPLAFIKYAVKHGWRITVLTYETQDNVYPSGTQLLKSVPPEVNVLRLPAPNLAPSFNWYPKIQGEDLLQALNLFEGAVDRLAAEPPTLVMATGPLFYSFVTAYYLSKYCGAKLVLDYRDEWTEWPFGIFTIGKSDYRWERRCLRAATLVFFTTESQRRQQLRVFPELDGDKCHLMPNGWEPSDFSESPDATRPAVDMVKRIVLTHAGVFGGHINTIGFLGTLRLVLERREDLRRRLKLCLVGIKDAKTLDFLRDFPFPSVIEMTDQVPKVEATRLMKNSTALLLIYSGSFERYIPGKLYDYLAAGRPVLVFGEKGEACDIVRRFGAGLVVPPDHPAALEAALDTLGEEPLRLKRDDDGLGLWLSEHTRDRMSRRMLDVINQL